jgi:hypothetical protein
MFASRPKQAQMFMLTRSGVLCAVRERGHSDARHSPEPSLRFGLPPPLPPVLPSALADLEDLADPVPWPFGAKFSNPARTPSRREVLATVALTPRTYLLTFTRGIAAHVPPEQICEQAFLLRTMVGHVGDRKDARPEARKPRSSTIVRGLIANDVPLPTCFKAPVRNTEWLASKPFRTLCLE